MKGFKSVALAATVLVAQPALADVMVGKLGNSLVEARSLIVGMTPTADTPTTGGGDPIFRAPMPQYSGVAALIMDYGQGQRFICSGSLMAGGRDIVTAAHCVRPRLVNGVLVERPQVTAFFYGGNEDIRVVFNPASTAVDVSRIAINPGYTGQVIDHNDIAVLRLSQAAPDFATQYRLSTQVGLTGTDFNVAGYGGRSTIGGDFGNDAVTGYLRQGDNMYDFRMGDPIFNGGWPGVFATPPINWQFSYLSDFDNGLAANDTACQVAQASNLAGPAGAIFCNLGRGATEVGVAGGDSGGPQFVRGRIASVTSYGLTFGTDWGDCRAGLNSSCGEFSGYVPIYIHREWIRANAIPEPATWGLMIAGFGLVGAAARRRRATASVAG